MSTQRNDPSDTDQLRHLCFIALGNIFDHAFLIGDTGDEIMNLVNGTGEIEPKHEQILRDVGDRMADLFDILTVLKQDMTPL